MFNKILTFGFDDSEIYDRKLCRMFRKFGMKSTFFLISGQLSFRCNFHRYNEDTVVERVSSHELKQTYKNMEIATHTAEHIFPSYDVENSVINSAKYLSALCGYEVRGLAYPGGIYSKEHIEALNKTDILYARTTDVTHSFELPKKRLAWNPTCKYDDPKLNVLIDNFLNYNGYEPILFYIYGHSYELTRKGFPYNWESFESSLIKLSGRDDVWYATNIEIAEWLDNLYTNH